MFYNHIKKTIGQIILLCFSLINLIPIYFIHKLIFKEENHLIDLLEKRG